MLTAGCLQQQVVTRTCDKPRRPLPPNVNVAPKEPNVRCQQMLLRAITFNATPGTRLDATTAKQH